MNDFPLQLVLSGIANTIIEPFCYGCAGFIVSYRFSRHLSTKILCIVATVFIFVWTDDIWPSIAARSVKLGVAYGNADAAEMFEDRRRLGWAEYATGERSGLWEIYDLGIWDVGSAVLFVPLAFHVGILLTRRRWNESSPRGAVPPPPPVYCGYPPPPPPSNYNAE